MVTELYTSTETGENRVTETSFCIGLFWIARKTTFCSALDLPFFAKDAMLMILGALTLDRADLQTTRNMQAGKASWPAL